MAKTIVEKKEVTRNGVTVTFVKDQGSGEKAKQNWHIQIEENLLEVNGVKCPLAVFAGKRGNIWLSKGMDRQLVLWYHYNGQFGTSDDLFFARFKQDSLSPDRSTNVNTKSTKSKLDKAKSDNIKMRNALLAAGKTEEEIDEIVNAN